MENYENLKNQIKEIINYDGLDELSEFKFSFQDILMWPFIRYYVLGGACKKLAGIIDVFSHKDPGKSGFAGKVRYLIDSFGFASFDRNPSDIIIFCSDVYNTQKKDEKYFNRFYDHYALCFPEKTHIMEQSYRREPHKTPRYFNNISFYGDWVEVYSAIMSRIRGVEKKKSQSEIRRMVSFVRSTFPIEMDDAFYNGLHNITSYLSGILPYYWSCYKKFLEAKRPGIIFIDDGSYGGINSIIIKLANDMGIVTAEMQHGNTSSMECAYNFSSAFFKNSELKSYLPFYFLTFGDYWNTVSDTPSEKYVVGNPEFCIRTEELKYNFAKDKKTETKSVSKFLDKKRLIIISQSTLSSEFIRLTEELSSSSPDDILITLKLHPAEVSNMDRYEHLKTLKNVSIMASGDLYKSIYEHDYVIGSYSTSLFEAMALGRSVFILNNNLSRLFVPESFGIWFNNGSEIIDIIKKNESLKSEENIEYYFASGWKERYISFIEKFS